MNVLQRIQVLYHYPCPDGVFALLAAHLYLSKQPHIRTRDAAEKRRPPRPLTAPGGACVCVQWQSMCRTRPLKR